ncbi:unnamed protein product [Bemisia tabaci]|uniref:Uncharacterized protein n=1 Tax=Bemisia tabaci TaxID=7038 RepID=A0A9P0G0Y5_BEMTA|nr:unnamed protein product [Bemisia tabaci]
MELRLNIILNILLICHFVASSEDSGLAEENVTSGGKTWALLVAGTNGWSYYRHQANICHAYKTLMNKFNMPKDRIITMFYDDVANDGRNPRPGELINEPNGTDVYKGVVKDYTGEKVSLDNFYKILKGDKSSKGKVIEPNAQNRIFIFFTGTGGKGGFSRLIGETIWADSFSKTLLDLKKNKKMKEALVYWESSHSGAMFDTYLPYSSGVLALTSAAADEDSFGWYCNVDDMPVCLAGHFSSCWLDNADQKSAPKQSIFEHQNGVRQCVTSSHPNLYGSFKLGLKKLPYFFGGNKMAEDSRSDFAAPDELSEQDSLRVASEENTQEEKTKGLAEIDIPVAMLEGQISNAKSVEEKTRLEEELSLLKKNRNLMDQTMDKILDLSMGGLKVDLQDSSFTEHRRCFKKLAIQFQKLCFDNSNYYVDHILPKLFTVCKASAEERAIESMSTVCTEQHRSLKNAV